MLNVSRIAPLFIVLSLLPFGEAWPAGFRADPTLACDFMAAEGLPTRGGYRDSGDRHHCRSQRRNLVSGGAINNSIRFVAQGDAESVTEVRLELQVNSRTGEQRTLRQMVEFGRSLIMAALGAEMPEEIESAILGATAGSWDVRGGTVRLERITVAAPGYELRLRIQ